MSPRRTATPPARRPPLDAAADERLVELSKAGNEAAFAVIVERYRVPLLRYCARVIGEGAAQDAVQDALLNAWRALSEGVEVRTLRPWLFTIAHRAMLTVLRDQRRPTGELPDTLTRNRSSADEADEQAGTHETLAALAGLPDAERAALIHSALYGHSGRQIGRALEVDEATARHLVYRARAMMRATRTTCVIPAIPLIRLARRLRGHAPRVPVVFISGRAENGVGLLKAAAAAAIATVFVGATAFPLTHAQHPHPRGSHESRRQSARSTLGSGLFARQNAHHPGGKLNWRHPSTHPVPVRARPSTHRLRSMRSHRGAGPANQSTMAAPLPPPAVEPFTRTSLSADAAATTHQPSSTPQAYPANAGSATTSSIVPAAALTRQVHMPPPGSINTLPQTLQPAGQRATPTIHAVTQAISRTVPPPTQPLTPTLQPAPQPVPQTVLPATPAFQQTLPSVG